jgi:RimJ/RimL family protein N-acetyltransferase
LFKKELSEEIPAIPNSHNIIVKKIPITTLKQIRESHKGMPMEFYCDLFDGADTCFVAFIDEQPVHIRWVYYKDMYSKFFKLNEKEAEFTYTITLPQFRGLRISFLTAWSACQWLKDNKYERVFVSIHADNINAIKSLKRQGFIKFAEIKRYGFLPFIKRFAKVDGN